MKPHLFGARRGRWIGLATLACVIVSLGVVSPPSLMPRSEAVARLQADTVTLDTLRFDFDRAWRASENAAGRIGVPEFDDAIARVERSVDRLDGGGGADARLAVPIRQAIGTYRDAVAAAPIVARTRDATGTDASAIELTIGQLAAADETALREPLLGMLDARREFEATGEPRFAARFNFWSDEFLTRLSGLPIPEGTRSGLAIKLAAYQHAALNGIDFVGTGPEAPRAAAMAVTAAVNNLDQALTARRKAMTEALDRRLVWLAGGSFVLIVIAAVVLSRDIRRDLGIAAGRTPERAARRFAMPVISSAPPTFARHG
jgi:hypothetical protein